MTELDENGLVVNLVQACLGSISPNVKSITMMMNGKKEVRCVFVLRVQSNDDEEEIEDIVCEFEALVSSYVNVTVDIWVGKNVPREGRHVFIAK